MNVVRQHPPRTRTFDDRPLLVLWETTKACALACAHCRADAQPMPGPDDLTTHEGYELIDSLAAIGAPRPILILTGGDCLARPDLVELVSYARAARLPVALAPSVTPRLTAATMSEMHRLGARTASVSLDGASPRSHDTLRRVPGHFDETIHKIALLKECGFTVQVNTTVTGDNIDELARVAAVLYRNGVDIWEVFFLISTGRGTDVAATSPAQNEDVCHFLVDASRYGMTVRTVEAPFFRRVALERREAGDVATEVAFDVGEHYLSLRDELIDELGAPHSPMRAPSAATRDGKGVIFVSNAGDVYPSGFLPMRLGNVKQRALVDIYRDDPVLRSIRSASFAGACGSCTYADLCGGSRARAYAATGDALAEDPGCLLVEESLGASTSVAVGPRSMTG